MQYVDINTLTLTNEPGKGRYKYNPNQSKIKEEDLPGFLASLINLLSMNTTLSESLKEIAYSYQDYASLFYKFKSAVDSGYMLPSVLTLEDHLKRFHSLLDLGYKSGNIIETLKLLKVYFDTVTYVSKKISSLLRQPALYLIIAVGIFVTMVVFLFPRFGEMINNMGQAGLPGVTLLFLEMSKHPIPVIIGAVFFIAVFLKYQKQLYMHFPGRNQPIRKLFKDLDIFLISSLMGLGLSSGMRPTDVVDMLLESKYSDPLIEKGLLEMKDNLSRGFSLKDSFSDKLPRELKLPITVGEASGRISELLLDIARIKKEEISIEVEKASSLVQNISILVIGVIVGSVVGALYLSIFSFISNIGGSIKGGW
ncbi:MAG: type II secretion system F family protein [Conexivisphaerales archaeon]